MLYPIELWAQIYTKPNMKNLLALVNHLIDKKSAHGAERQ
jgi:hypothetical protein